MQLKVKLLKGGREETVEVRDDLVKVEVLKQALAEVFSIPSQEQSLVYKGKALLASHCLRDYNISDGAKLFLAHKLTTTAADGGLQQPPRVTSSADGGSRGDVAVLATGGEGRSEEGGVVLTVRVLKGGREERIEVENDRVTILDIKKVLEGRCGVPTPQQSLVLAGRALSDSERLCDCNVVTGTTLFLAQKTAPPEPTPPVPRPSVWTHHTDFWPNLRQFLLKHFSPDDTERILSNMEEELRRSVYDVNLDTIESLAAHIFLQQQHL